MPNCGRALRAQPGLLASDSQIPPPISAMPDIRPSHFVLALRRKKLRPAPASIAQPQSVADAIVMATAHITAS